MVWVISWLVDRVILSVNSDSFFGRIAKVFMSCNVYAAIGISVGKNALSNFGFTCRGAE
jgi:hypothetical protein